MSDPFSRLCPLSARWPPHRRRGFNLIEASIVLCVVGLIIGGIWVAATAVTENRRTNETLQGILSTVANVQKTISMSDSETIGNSVSLLNMLISAGAFPSNWVSGAVYHPFNNIVSIRNYTPARFDFTLHAIPDSACIKIVPRLTGYATGSSLQLVQILSESFVSSFSSSTFPVTPAQAKSGCRNGLNLLVITYGYTRVN